MGYSEKKKEYNVKYTREKVKRIALEMQKEYYEKTLAPAVTASGLSINGYIKQAIAEKIERDASRG